MTDKWQSGLLAVSMTPPKSKSQKIMGLYQLQIAHAENHVLIDKLDVLTSGAHCARRLTADRS
jgi:hypothetical protein